MTVNGLDLDTSHVGFEYELPSIIRTLVPTKTVAKGGGLLSVVGENFRASALLQASLGGQYVRLIWVTSSLATCVVPAPGRR